MAGASLYPLPDHKRIRGETEAAANGGREEVFHIELKRDQLGRQSKTAALFPFAGFSMSGDQPVVAEAFQIRNKSGQVIGVASRLEGIVPDSIGEPSLAVNWLLVIPARGALLLEQKRVMSDVVAPGMQALHGRMTWGDREFAELSGSYIEARMGMGSGEPKIVLSTRLASASVTP